MILTCPECATSYFVDELRIPRLGRMVRCSNCSARWRAFQDRSEPDPEPSADDLLVEDRPIASAPAQDIAFAAAPVTPRRPAAPPKRAPVGRYAAIGAAVGLAVVVGASVMFRQKVAAIAPVTAPLFAALGLPVDTLGLVIEDVKSQALLEAGRPVLSVTGAIHNTRGEPVQAPPIRINLLDKGGRPVSGLVASPLNGRIPPGARRYFAVSLPAPPAGVRDLEIGFEPGQKRTLAAPIPPASPAPTAPAPGPVEAQSLPPGSPDALSKHE